MRSARFSFFFLTCPHVAVDLYLFSFRKLFSFHFFFYLFFFPRKQTGTCQRNSGTLDMSWEKDVNILFCFLSLLLNKKYFNRIFDVCKWEEHFPFGFLAMTTKEGKENETIKKKNEEERGVAEEKTDGHFVSRRLPCAWRKSMKNRGRPKWRWEIM